MGDEISTNHFSDSDYQNCFQRLEAETEELRSWFKENAFSEDVAMGGFEQEAWIVDSLSSAAPANQYVIDNVKSDLLSPELAKFNLEMNVTPQMLEGKGLELIYEELKSLWEKCEDSLTEKKLRMQMIGILPTISESELVLSNMSDMNRYMALNDQVIKFRDGKPFNLDIVGNEHLKSEHSNVMLESAATSFQIHRQIPAHLSARYYNTSAILSAITVAVSANSPYLFDKNLWSETRIPLFEQSVEIGGYGQAMAGPVRRVTFGSGYLKESVMECFDENLAHYPVLLPVILEDEHNTLPNLHMHNGTIWRWNRPLIGFNKQNEPHLRIEHRVLPAGPTLKDELANGIFFFGLQEYFANLEVAPESSIHFSDAKNNFYLAAQHGLSTHIHWLDGKQVRIDTLILNELIDIAREGLASLNVDLSVIDEYMSIIESRVRSGQTGAKWQTEVIKKYGVDMPLLANKYWEKQKSGLPVHEWSI